jgi:hypothetical protein
MAITENKYTGNGSTVLYSFTFPYLEVADIKVSLDGTLTTAYTLANATTVQFNTAPANGVAIRLFRQTNDDALNAQFFPGSAIRSTDLNNNFTQNLYVTQESNRDATQGITTADAATATANTALSNSSAAVSTANTASSNASAAVSTANTASSNASAAVSTANTASSNATAAVNTANAATATANSAASDAATAISTANSAVSTANTASTTATNAVNTANSASSAASSAVSTANTASSNASAAVSTANTASSNATSAVNTANSALSTANAAASAVANAILYDIVANVAAIPASPANNDAVEVIDSTGIESFTPLTSIPGGFAGNSGLSVRIVYTTTGNTWTWIQYFPNDPETRYLKEAVTTSDTAPVSPSDGDLWYDSVGGRTYVYYDDGDTSQWVDTSPQGSGVSDAISEGNTSAEVIDTGSDGRFVVTTEGTERLRVDPSGRLLVGTSTSDAQRTASMQIASAGGLSGWGSSASLSEFGTSYNPWIVLQRSRNGTVGSHTVVSNGDILGGIQFTGSDGDSFEPAAWIKAEVDGTPGNGDMPGRLVFSTTADGASVPTERLRITSAGLVGIGSSSPDQALSVGSGAADTRMSINGTGQYQLKFTNSGAAGFWIGSPGANSLAFAQDDGTTRMTIDSSGRLGIGTTTADYKLDVNGSAQIRVGESLYFQNVAANGRASIQCVGAGTNTDLAISTAGSERVRIDSSGRLLIGTSSTSKDFRAVFQGNSADATGGANLLLARGTSSPADGSAIGYLTFTDSNHNATALIQAQRDGGTWDSGASQPGRLVFSTTANGASSPTERMRITSGGFLKISNDNSYTGIDTNAHGVRQGTGNNWTWMPVNDTVNPFGINISFPAAAPNNTTNLFMRCQDSGNARLDIRSNGGLANYQANDVNLSDINSKKDISPAADTWDCIKEWEIVNYRYKDQPDNADLNLGVIAQQVAESCPEVITVFSEATEDQPEKLGVKEQQMYWMAIKALQEAQLRIETLEAANTNLAARLTALEGGTN